MAVDQVVGVVAVGHRFVPAAGSVAVALVVAVAAVLRGAAVRIRAADLQHMLVHMILVGMVEVAVVQIIDVIAVTDGDMAACRPMLVRMSFVDGVVMCAHSD